VKWLRRVAVGLAVAYPICLLAAATTLRYVGEAWWVSTVGLYLPRVGFALPLPILAVALRILRMHRLLWLQAISGLVILFPLMGLVLPRPTSAEHAPTLRVLSFNVNAGYGGPELVVDEIDRYAPDIVMLQETGGNAAFGPLLRSKYPTVEVADQFVTASRYPLTSTLDPNKLPYEGHLRSPRFVRHLVDSPLGRIAIYNVHPISPREALFGLRGKQGLKHELLSGRFFRGAESPMLESNVGLRALQVRTFSEAATRETDPVIIAGDTNLPNLSPLMHRYLSAYADGFASAGWGFGYTFPTNKWRPWMRIDRILASEQLRFVRFDVGQSKVSDHRCVVAELQRQNP
jgi:endonuclease/exonuclease/phosphatase (EEP) superfamily protein YafD